MTRCIAGNARWWNLICLVAGAIGLWSGSSAFAADDGEPLLRLEAGGPTSYVTALAFSPDGKTLYAGSWDKTVRVWRLNAQGEFQLNPAAWRVPIGPGLDGAINAVAVSSDGRWLAAAGKAIVQGAADFRNPGRVLPTVGGMTDEMRLDEGTIYVFDTNNRTTYTLRGHRGEVRALAFAPSSADEPMLVSAAREWQSSTAAFIGAARLWNVTAAQPHLASRGLPEPKHETWPKLAVQRTGAKSDALNIGIAWGDGSFRVWDVQANRVNEAMRQGQFLDTVVFNDAASEFITGAVGDDGSTRIRSWRAVANAAPQMDAGRSIDLAKAGEAIVAPRGLALASIRADGKADTLFAVIHRHSLREADQDQYELWYMPPTRGAKIQPFRLWDTGPPPRRVPVIASAPQGRHIAVTRGAEIYVYAIDSLSAGRNEPSILRSAGEHIRGVAFVRQGAAADAPLGLALTERTMPPPAGLNRLAESDAIFDLKASKLQDYKAADGWRLAASPAGDWRLQVEVVGPPQRAKILIQQGDQRRGTIELEAGFVLTDYAFCATAKPPIVAVAAHHDGLPILELYAADSGRRIRRLSAHSALVRSVAFSDDGQLLASAADDQTVCLWRLADLDKIVNEHGMAEGVAVVANDDGLLVAGEGKAGALNAGDIILGRIIGDKLLTWQTPQAFYDAFWNARPGETIRIRKRDINKKIANVDVPVVQGTDERKPLLSLFITRANGDQPRGWIAWNPMGPYQSSAQDVEQYLGWHFNTGRNESPVAFALAGEYREKYYRENLIDALIKTGMPPENKQATAPLPAPLLDLVIDGGEAINFGKTILVRAAPTRASLLVAGLPIDGVQNVELQIGAQPPVALERQSDGETWSVAFDPGDWKHGEHRVQAIVHTKEARPQHFDITRIVRYQAAAPILKLTHRKVAGGTILDEAAFTFAAEVQPGEMGEAMLVTLTQRHGQESKVLQEWTTDKPLTIEKNVELLEGGNVLELVARNRDALVGFESSEVAVDRATLNYSPRMELPSLVELTLLPLEAGQPVPTLDLQSPTIVTIDKIQLAGEIKGSQGQLEVASSLGGDAAPIKVSPVVADKPTRFSTEDIALKPGVQTIRIRRQDGVGPAVETEAQIEYRPPLPNLIVEAPLSNATLVDGRDEPKIALAAKLTAVSHRHPFEAVILINDKPSNVKPTLDLEAGTLAAEIPLSLGENQIVVRLTNAWNPPSDHPIAVVKYLSLPTVDKFAELGAVKSPVIDVVASGKSSLPITALEISSDFLPTRRLALEEIEFDKAAGTWQATIKSLPMLRDPQELAVQVWNEHGPAQKPGRLALPAWIQMQSPPTIDLASGGNVTSADFELTFTVHSRKALQSVAILHNENRVDFAPKVAELKADPTGGYTLAAKVPLTLLPGDNRISVTAANAGGLRTEQSLVNYIDPPARVVIDRLETVDLPKKIVLPIVSSNGRARAQQPSPTAKVLVRGRLEWPRSIDPAYLRRLKRLQVWVNGFQQAPVDIAPPVAGQLTSEFSAFVVLNQDKDNRLQIALPDLTPDIATLFDAYVDCEAPVREQRLHLLVIGVSDSPGAQGQLMAEMLTAIKAKKTDRGLSTAAFDRVALYGPIVGADITPQQVRSQLAQIKVKIDELYKTNKSSVRPANDVVMIYLQGGTLAEAEGDFYITTRTASDPRTERALREREPRILMDVALRSRTLVDFLTYTTGAHLLMLDVTGTKQVEQVARWPIHSHAAMLRYTWLKESTAPAQARLLAALPEAMEASGELREIDANIAKIHVRLAGEFPLSVAYKPQVPESLEDLLLGETLPKKP